MPGKLPFKFRGGSRGEYLAQYILSSLGTSNPVLRQEDVGIDFVCSLSYPDRETFHSPYAVQLKSAKSESIEYGGFQDGKWKDYEVTWILNQPMPLFLGVVDHHELRLKLYSLSSRWSALHQDKRPTRIKFVLDSRKEGEELPKKPFPWTYPKKVIPKKKIEGKRRPIWHGDGKSWVFHIGPPILSITAEESNDPNIVGNLRERFKNYVFSDRMNYLYSRLGTNYVIEPDRIFTNRGMNSRHFVADASPGKLDYEDELKAILPMLLAIADKSERQKNGLASNFVQAGLELAKTFLPADDQKIGYFLKEMEDLL